ncbi:chemotaxis protein CheW [bacterium]|jgi:chemotaxis signal transduction protein|nr:chemotaxis protein CheW [bacterium]
MPNKSQKFILVQIDGHQYALPVSSSYHFFHIQEITPIPQTDKRIMGFTYHNGHIVTLLDTASIFGLKVKKKNEKCAMVKFEHHYYGWVIELAGEIVSKVIHQKKEKNILKQYILVDKKKIQILSVRLVLNEINLDD